MDPAPLTVIDIKQKTELISAAYKNFPLCFMNDHVIRVSVMTRDFYWHFHPNSDQTFLVIEGDLLIDLDDETVELHTGQLFTVPKNVSHRTRPQGKRSVNITFERDNIDTVKVER